MSVLETSHAKDQQKMSFQSQPGLVMLFMKQQFRIKKKTK